ncbi:unnamed protein product [Phyllotreta striolata]|uniref:Cytosine-specific methyltransferase n=1 Tax=Phyllotreta striolata TaxID=444603 RepID=A0A9N9THF0_PHYSR|nr:unnamed protein product [Phyllotreta striolata]
MEENENKRVKTDREVDISHDEQFITKPFKKTERCSLCKQFLDSVSFYGGHPNYSNEEYVVLTDEKLNIYTGTETNINDDDVPTQKITYFSVYDKNGHLCPFDTGLIEGNIHLYFSGYVKPVFDDDSNPDNGVPAKDLGPIDEWFLSGYDGGEKILIGFTTAFAHYYLMDPSMEYQPIYEQMKDKTRLVKLVVEYLLDHAYDNPVLEDLIEHLEACGEVKDVADKLVQHAQFICDQVASIDCVEEEEQPLYTLPCIRTLIEMARVSFKKHKKIKPFKVSRKKKSNIMTKAVTTKLVKDVFECFFPEQIESKDLAVKKMRCGVCEACQSPDCGKCSNCLNMRKFGGLGKSKQACKLRRCMYMAIKEAELSDNEEESDLKSKKKKETAYVSKKTINKVKWLEESSTKYKTYQCYSSAQIGNFIVKTGEYVMLKPESDEHPLYIAKIIYMYDKFPQKYVFHAHLFCRGIDSILGETANPRELFVVDDCEELLLGSIVRKAKVEYRKIPPNWFELGGELNLGEEEEDDGETFFFTKRLESNRFVDLDFNPEEIDDLTCYSCRRKELNIKSNTPVLKHDCVYWRNEEYKVGSGVFLEPSVYKFEVETLIQENDKENRVNEAIYPEYYRKRSDNVKGSNNDTPNPFVIGLIESIDGQSKDVRIKVKVFFRPEHTFRSLSSTISKDLCHLYYSEEVITVSFESVMGKCYLSYGYQHEDSSEWAERGPFRFYFTEAYDPKTREFGNVPTCVKAIGTQGIGKGKGSGKGKKSTKAESFHEWAPDWQTPPKPLRCMDVFAGCGGLSEGLKQSGIVESKWAIEVEPAAANAFKLNNPYCKVFTEDCNQLLKSIINDEGPDIGLPSKGDVEMLVGGPPCQGFSGMNRFNSRNYSSFKNSLVVSYLSYCEYYRPKYFILENVRNFVTFKKSMVLKLTLRCLLAMGYQVTFGVLQAGQYGIPQTRRRLIIMAAAPGYVLPKFPEPQHVFSRKGTHLAFVVDGFNYSNECLWTESAPYRTITVRDALCDLPPIPNGSQIQEVPYDTDPLTHFQRKIRGNSSNTSAFLRDHICKEMSQLVAARISQIPTYPGADWRDLPNIKLRLPDGNVTQELKYTHWTKKQSSGEKAKGVCSCVETGVCDPADKQCNTLIPWCLPHTGDRHNHWAGLYGRLEWDGYFGTTITNPEPMGKQGRVLHPEQHRVVGVRECARSQGFPDKFKFCGSIMDKYRQVGNAVPPPLGCALGREFVKALTKKSE